MYKYILLKIPVFFVYLTFLIIDIIKKIRGNNNGLTYIPVDIDNLKLAFKIQKERRKIEIKGNNRNRCRTYK